VLRDKGIPPLRLLIFLTTKHIFRAIVAIIALSACCPSPATATQTAAAIKRNLVIVRGDTASGVAKKLLSLDLIEDTVAFLDRLSDLGLTGELLDGKYELEVGLDLDVLIDKIVVHK